MLEPTSITPFIGPLMEANAQSGREKLLECLRRSHEEPPMSTKAYPSPKVSVKDRIHSLRNWQRKVVIVIEPQCRRGTT